MTPTAHAALRVDGARLWRSLMHSAQIGATADGGLCRLALSAEDGVIRNWLAAECAGLGAHCTVDRLGNMFARVTGRQDGPPIAIGSHLDTQPTGGRFDGILGVLAGLEVMRTLREAGHTTHHPLELINWTNEEGARFQPAMVASGAFAGVFTPESVLASTDAQGILFADALGAIGYAGTEPVGHELAAYFELHIEQGPVLEAAATEIGVVTGVQGIRWREVVVAGQNCHAGTTPMALRRDPVFAAARMSLAARAACAQGGLATIGMLRAHPGSRNTVPAEVRFTLDLRHADQRALDALETTVAAAFAAIAAEEAVGLTITANWDSPPVAFDPACIAAVTKAAAALGVSHQRIVSGAGHDAVYTARVAPTAMIFTPCLGGISHNPAESITPAQAAAGANVLLHAVLNHDLAHAP